MAAGGDDIFVYLGGEQVVPDGVTHAIIDPSVNTVRRRAFTNRRHLISVIFHDGVEIVEQEAFDGCVSLPRIKLLGVREIGHNAFSGCAALSDVEFGGKLETIGKYAFHYCNSLRSIKSLSVRNIQERAFRHCWQLRDVEFGVDLETIGIESFNDCEHLKRIVLPLKDDLFLFDTDKQRYSQFDGCSNFSIVDIAEAVGTHKTISSFLMKTWRDEMNQEIDRINRELPSTHSVHMTNKLRLWIRSVINRISHYKAEHKKLLKEHMTLLELAVWKAKLDERDDSSTLKVQTKRARIDEESSREEKRITSGADIIIKNVLPFLKLA